MKNVYLIGDLHGSFKPVRDFCSRNPALYKQNDNVLICLGDFGANYFFNRRDDEYKTRLGKYPLTYFVIRGNHEERPSLCMERDPENWHTEDYFGNLVYVENKYPYIKYAIDELGVYNINGYKTLVIPGAYSVDKYYRLLKGMSWFEEEQLSTKEMIHGSDLLYQIGYKADLVLSHTCPIIFEPTDLFLCFVDQSMVDKSMERFLGEVEYELDYKLWCWGHYHAFRDYPRTDGRKRVMLSAGEEVIELKQVYNEDGMVKKI
jgi:3-oxoacid CoA-transferase subunit A